MTDSRAQAQSFYEQLRSANPWLPPAEKVSADDQIALQFGPGHLTSLTLTVLLDEMPKPEASPPEPGTLTGGWAEILQADAEVSQNAPGAPLSNGKDESDV